MIARCCGVVVPHQGRASAVPGAFRVLHHLMALISVPYGNGYRWYPKAGLRSCNTAFSKALFCAAQAQ